MPNCVQTGHPEHRMIMMSQMARDQLLFFSFPVEAGFCPYIAGPALSAVAITRALLLCAYSPEECVEDEFCGLRLYSVTRKFA